MEAGLKEFAAAILAGAVLGIVLDFLYVNSTTAGWFARPLGTSSGNGGMLPIPANNAGGGVPSGGGVATSTSSAMPAATTC